MYQSTSTPQNIVRIFFHSDIVFSYSVLLLFSFHFSLFRLDQPTRHVLLQRFNLRLRSMWTFQRGTLPRCRACLKVRPLLFRCFLRHVFCFLNPSFLILFSPPTTAFFNSGFTRTLCGGRWEALKDFWRTSDNRGSSTARLGCCPAGSFMVNPYVAGPSNQFTEASSCLKCIGGSSVENDDTTCAGNVVYTSLPDGDCTVSGGGISGLVGHCNNCDTGLRKVISDWIDDTTRSSVVAIYGPIEDWDISEVTNMKCIFYYSSQNDFNTFNADISKWNTSAVTTMERSKHD